MARQKNTASTVSVVDDRELDRIAEATHRMGLAERIHFWDKRQSAKTAEGAYAEGVTFCTNDRTHGAMCIRGDGAALICTKVKQGAGCTAVFPVST